MKDTLEKNKEKNRYCFKISTGLLLLSFKHNVEKEKSLVYVSFKNICISFKIVSILASYGQAPQQECSEKNILLHSKFHSITHC